MKLTAAVFNYKTSWKHQVLIHPRVRARVVIIMLKLKLIHGTKRALVNVRQSQDITQRESESNYMRRHSSRRREQRLIKKKLMMHTSFCRVDTQLWSEDVIDLRWIRFSAHPWWIRQFCACVCWSGPDAVLVQMPVISSLNRESIHYRMWGIRLSLQAPLTLHQADWSWYLKCTFLSLHRHSKTDRPAVSLIADKVTVSAPESLGIDVRWLHLTPKRRRTLTYTHKIITEAALL